MKSIKKALLVLLCFSGSALQADLLDTLGFKQKTEIDVVIGEEKKTEKDIERLKKEIAIAESETSRFEEELQAQMDKVKGLIKETEARAQVEKEDTYVSKQLFTLKSWSQTLTNIRTARKGWITTLKSRLILLESIEEERVARAHEEKKSLYTFEELQGVNRKIASEEDKLAHIRSEEGETKLDLEDSKKKADAAEREYKEKVKEQADFGKEVQLNDQYAREKSQLIDLEVKHTQAEKTLADLRVKEKTAKLDYVRDAADAQEKKLVHSREKKDFIVRMSLRVDQQDVIAVTERLREEKRIYLNDTDTLLHAIEKYSAQEEQLKKELQALDAKYPDKSSGSVNLDEWAATPQSVDGFLGFIERALKNAEMRFIENKIDFERAQIQLKKMLFKEYELAVQTVESWYKIKHQLFKTSEQLHKETAKYQETAAELGRERSIYEDKRNTATNRLNMQNKSLFNIRSLMETLQNKKQTLFKGEESKYVRCMQALTRAEAIVAKQIEITGRLIEIYSKILVSSGGSIKEINSMIAELQRVSLWHRSGGAISREGLSNIIPDVQSFLSDVRTLGYSYIANFSVRSVGRRISNLLSDPFSFVLLLWKIFLLFLFFVLLHRYLPALEKFFMAVGTEYRGAFLFSRIGALSLEFVHEHLVSLYLWFLLFFFVGVNAGIEIYPSIVFFLVSIPYLLYLSWAFIKHVRQFNIDHEYELYPESFAPRFNVIGSIFLYTSVVLLFFREAFILATYTKSDLPSVLLAIYSIIVRILLLALIRKEDLLSVIPSRTTFGAFAWRAVDQYYYLLLGFAIFLMVLSDPHIGGYDNLVSYVFWGLFGTILVSRLLFLLYGFCRRLSSFVFFSSDGETLNERFQNSKTWYGLTVVFLFVIFLVIGLWIIAWFWGKAIPLASIGDFFAEKRLAIGLKDGQYQQKVSIIDLVRTFLFIPLAFFVAHIVDKFVLDRIFNVLLVDTGVHNAVSTITYYLVVISVFTLGLINEGFGFLVVYYLLPLLVGMAFALREIFNDFVAYFVLLIQRPLKVGDYIQINEEVKGVVRKITPRAVILRRKRSFHLVVPNSKLMQEVIVNWDYTRGFITFPDIIVGIRYACDPELTKQVLEQAVDSVTNVLKTPAPIIRLDEFGPSGYVFMVRGYISSEMTLQQWVIASDVRFAIVKFLHKNNIEISFPVRVIRMMGESKHQQYLDPNTSPGRPAATPSTHDPENPHELPGEEFPEN